jgi:hypothetical protein
VARQPCLADPTLFVTLSPLPVRCNLLAQGLFNQWVTTAPEDQPRPVARAGEIHGDFARN